MYRILIVDDDVPNHLELNYILQSDYKLYSVKDGISALKKAEKSRPDLILLDVIMPGMSGYDVLIELKKSDITKDIPVIFITGMQESSDKEKGLALGAVDNIDKPFNSEDVMEKIRKYIN